MSVKEALELARRKNAVAADFRFCDFLGTWQHHLRHPIGYKRKNEIDALRLRPHPYEFELYFDA